MAVFPVFYFPLLGTPTAPFNELSFYVAGTDTSLNVYSDVSGDTAWAQPIVFNAASEAPGVIYVDPDTAYKVVYEDENGVAIPGYPVDFIPPGEMLNVMTSLITTLTNAQIKALPTTPITLVDAPASGLRVRPFCASLRLDSSAGAYTNVEPTYAALSIDWSGTWALGPVVNDSSSSPASSQVTQFFQTAHDYMVDLVAPFQSAIPSSPNGWVLSGGPTGAGAVLSASEATALQISMDNSGTGNLTGGNAANTLTVTVYYSLESVV